MAPELLKMPVPAALPFSVPPVPEMVWPLALVSVDMLPLTLLTP